MTDFGSMARRPSTMQSVAIAHPERQHSHQMAAALSTANLLAVYIHGARLPNYVQGDIPPHLRRRNHWFQPARRALTRLVSTNAVSPLFVGLLETYDRWLARQLPRLACNGIVAYELSAKYTFEAAKKLGMACILDAASLHHSEQMRWLPGSNSAA